MATYGDDEEQLEALKRWWKDNGNSLLTGVIVVLAVFMGVRYWQSSQTTSAGAASDLYQQIVDLGVHNISTVITEDQLLAAQSVYDHLKTDYSGSIYTRYAALAMARYQVEQNQLDLAATELQWVLDNPGDSVLQDVDPEFLLTTRLRLARIVLAQGQAQKALDLLHAADPGTFAASYAEVEGDALLSMNNRDDARAAYKRALAAEGSANPVLLQLKLQDLGVNPQEQL